MRVACSCTESPASVQRNAFERARSARRARNSAGLGVMAPLVRTAHVSSMVCLTAWSRTHLFFIVFFFSIIPLPPLEVCFTFLDICLHTFTLILSGE